jgi:hypothetical protein
MTQCGCQIQLTIATAMYTDSLLRITIIGGSSLSGLPGPRRRRDLPPGHAPTPLVALDLPLKVLI